MHPLEFIEEVGPSGWVSEALFQAGLGGSKTNPDAAHLYLSLPPKSRPRISYLFDKTFYLEAYPDIAEAEEVDPFLHFMQHGCAERRSPHPLIDIPYIIQTDAFLLREGFGPNDLYEILHYDLADPSPYFSARHYRTQLPHPTQEVSGLIEHFLREGLHAGLWPNPCFDPQWYFRQLDGDQDVESGLRHLVRFGDREGRASCPEFSGKRYLERNPDVAAAGILPLRHFVTAGMAEGRPKTPDRDGMALLSLAHLAESGASSGVPTQEGSIALDSAFRRRVAGRRQDEKNVVAVKPIDIVKASDPDAQPELLALPACETPKVSILIPVYNETDYTVECLASIAKSQPKTDYEVIVADDASPDPSVRELANIPNIRFITQPANVGFLRNCNASFPLCRGEYLLLLNNDAQLMPGALDEMVAVLDANPDVAAVGPKILYPNGRLQEAGCAIDRHGVTTMVGLFADPARANYNYDRDVHYCSGAALLVRVSELDGELFDETFMPAYCEDTDLCLRLLAKGRRIVYRHTAVVVHHLSVSTAKQSVTRRLQLVARNQQKLTTKWAGLLEEMNKVRTIAFYLPQFHPTPENDFYWGQSFTEWTNVTKATPAYVGHYQPHLPTDLGFYDLRLKETWQKQAALARRYGIAGFCVYYYNFGKQRALHEPFEAMVADPSIDFPFCVCWANENWTRHWDGGTREPIFTQQTDAKTLRGVIQDAIRYAADPRYIRVNGKPLFVVYRPLLLPDPKAFAKRCRRMFKAAGFDGVYLLYVESMESAERMPRPDDLGFDGCVEFPPQGLAVRAAEPVAPILREGFVGARYDYEATVIESISRPPVGYKRHPSVFPSWDNTPRQPQKGDSFVGASPEVFQIYVEEKLEEVKRHYVGDERLLFVNAWNEWAEGTHLEPDRVHGHRWLEAIRNAMLTKSLA